ncbi:hypothetical protein SAMN05216236_11921 [Sedimentitalea nanhaiensis]|uniref:Uncharacterized protein n=1 Tax=Sedimentitalea nanhaiensis TaxID=999627 RepID=A0A1I7CRT3_9RHOB|nr:hypothetical protein SAMN05216236_11921 [Sedimentitalea nanhaiensis]
MASCWATSGHRITDPKTHLCCAAAPANRLTTAVGQNQDCRQRPPRLLKTDSLQARGRMGRAYVGRCPRSIPGPKAPFRSETGPLCRADGDGGPLPRGVLAAPAGSRVENPAARLVQDKMPERLIMAIQRFRSQIVSPGGGGTPPIITSPAAGAEITRTVFVDRIQSAFTSRRAS